MKTERSPEELAYVEARCNEAQAILRPKRVALTPEEELEKLKQDLGLKATEQQGRE